MAHQETIKTLLANNKASLSKEFGLRSLGIFGSVAEGRADEQSDIDLFYELVENRTLDLRQLAAFERKIKRILQKQKIDLVNLTYMNPIVRHRAEKNFIYV